MEDEKPSDEKSILVPISLLKTISKNIPIVVEENRRLKKQKSKTKIKIVVAPQKYTKDHYDEVDELIVNHGMKKGAARETVANKYGFNVESFSRLHRSHELTQRNKSRKK